MASACLPTLWQQDDRFRDAYLSEFPGYYKTSDAGYKDEDGYVWVMGRTDDIINVAGHRLSTGGMEEILASHPDVAECAVLGVKDAIKGEVPCGFLVLKAGVTKAPDQVEKEVVALVREKLGPVAAFKLAITVGRLPKTRSGKILRGTIKKIADETLPSGFSFEWTDLSYQQVNGANAGLYVFPICVLFVYLVLAAQYGSWTLPFAVILIVPMCLFAATIGVRIMGQDVNILTQIGFVVLVGLAAKNAILIVEFARDIELEGRPRLEAVIEACRLRLRPILMTSFAFILGVLPLVLSTGSGSEMRQAVGVAVFFGMLGVTLFGLVFTPIFYMVVRNLAEGKNEDKPKETAAAAG